MRPLAFGSVGGASVGPALRWQFGMVVFLIYTLPSQALNGTVPLTHIAECRLEALNASAVYNHLITGHLCHSLHIYDQFPLDLGVAPPPNG